MSTFVDPFGTTPAPTLAPAPALSTLDGRRIGLLDNNKTNADKFLTMVGEILLRDFGVAAVRMVAKEALSKPAPAAVLDELQQASDAVVVGIGDCGSCSTCCVHDAVELEKRGIPAVAVCTDVFVPGLQALATMRGMPDYRFAVVPHPLGVLFDEELRQRAESAAPQVNDLVTNNPLRARRAG
jgi:hypothetical protein